LEININTTSFYTLKPQPNNAISFLLSSLPYTATTGTLLFKLPQTVLSEQSIDPHQEDGPYGSNSRALQEREAEFLASVFILKKQIP
jgi:hypothetical protein